MARHWNGSTDLISCGSDASIDNFASITVWAWMNPTTIGSGGGGMIWNKANTIWAFTLTEAGADVNTFTFFHQRATTHADSRAVANTVTLGTWQFVAAIWDGSNASQLYRGIPGSAIAEVSYAVQTAGAGGATADAAGNLVLGNQTNATRAFDGAIGLAGIHSNPLTVADLNRARWWGCTPGGPSSLNIWHPCWSSDTNNKGTGTANGALTGTTMVAGPPAVERCWGSLLGCGR